jgi:hypothetical protein
VSAKDASRGKGFDLVRELDAIGTATAIVARADAERTRLGLGPVAEEKAQRLHAALVRTMRSAVSFVEIDAAARELYGDRFAGLSICDVYEKAKALAFERKGEQ